MAFNKFLQELVGDREPEILDMYQAFGVVATLYIEHSLNLVSETAMSKMAANEAIVHADDLFSSWEREVKSAESALRACLARNL